MDESTIGPVPSLSTIQNPINSNQDINTRALGMADLQTQTATTEATAILRWVGLDCTTVGTTPEGRTMRGPVLQALTYLSPTHTPAPSSRQLSPALPILLILELRISSKTK